MLKPVRLHDHYEDPYDVYADERGRLAYLEILIPSVFSRNGTIQTQFARHTRLRSSCAPLGQIYYALWMPFSLEGGICDSREKAIETISQPIFAGPFEFGISGPARRDVPTEGDAA